MDKYFISEKKRLILDENIILTKIASNDKIILFQDYHDKYYISLDNNDKIIECNLAASIDVCDDVISEEIDDKYSLYQKESKYYLIIR